MGIEDFDDPDELAAQLDHAGRLITELMDRVDALEAELACYWLSEARDRGVASGCVALRGTVVGVGDHLATTLLVPHPLVRPRTGSPRPTISHVRGRVGGGPEGGPAPLREDHADRLITELMDRVDRLEAELACYWLADARDRGVA